MGEEEQRVGEQGDQGQGDLEFVVVALDQGGIAVIDRGPIGEVHDADAWKSEKKNGYELNNQKTHKNSRLRKNSQIQHVPLFPY